MFHKITYNRKHDFATVHNYGCTFRCPICSYKLKSGADGIPGLSYPKPDKFLTIEEIKSTLLSVNPSSVHFMGGEPTVAGMLPEMLSFVKREMGAETVLGHTNGVNLSIPDLDAANVGLKAWHEDVHLKVTGVEKSRIYGELERAALRGMRVAANMIYIPGLVDVDQLSATARHLSAFRVPFHIMGYIPVPGQPYRRPTIDEMEDARRACREYIPDAEYSYLSPEEVLSLERNDDRFDVKVIAGSGCHRTLMPTAF
ncbi:MAG: radical SAM protein [Candidatus Methanoplasma sp.]|jgi:pyruvate formate lyase activating enzyme|nr:radical SAM protein [Candidatus Methanoplasma sp.]